MTILYIAFSCNPYNGTEDRLGWYIPYYASKENNVIIITKEEQREAIERFRKESRCDGLTVVYVDIPAIYKKIFKGPLYSGRQSIWNDRAYKEAIRICEMQQVDIIHQVTPVEFRSIGKYGSIKDVTYVCGPVGGGESGPRQLEKYMKGGRLLETVRAFANEYYKLKYRLDGRIERCNMLLFANRETRDFLISSEKRAKYQIMTELGSLERRANEQKTHDVFTILTGGRLIYRKGFDYLFDAVELIPEKYEFNIVLVGDGPLYGHLKKRVENSELLGKRVIMRGRIPHIEMEQEYRQSDLFFMPSLRETTGSVILEALENGVPVSAMGRYGAAVILDEKCGILYDLENGINPAQTVANVIMKCVDNPEKIRAMMPFCKQRAEELSYARRVEMFKDIYKDAIEHRL